MTLDNIGEEIRKATSIIILTHESPDGDAIGSSLAMYLVLKKMGKNVDIIIPEYPKIYNFLAGTEDIKKEGSSKPYDLAIALDCADIKRLNGFAAYFENAKRTISIDHHGVNTMFGDLNYVNPAAPACTQILASIFEYSGIEISKEVGECLLTGIITDTGGFKYTNVTAETFEFTAWLLSRGVNVSYIYEKVLQIMTRPQFELIKKAVNRMEFLENGKIAFTYITIEDEKEVNAEPGDHEGIVEQGRDVEGVEVSIFLRETQKGYRASLRSNNDKINVSDIGIIFGGGGHPKAAGCLLPFSLENAKEKLIAETKLQLK